MPNRQDNLLLLGVDSLWADHMSCYGYPKNTTPHLDRFASQGTLFEHNISAQLSGLACSMCTHRMLQRNSISTMPMPPLLKPRQNCGQR